MSPYMKIFPSIGCKDFKWVYYIWGNETFTYMILKGQKYLVTADNWFIAPNGQQYKSIWGKIEILPDSILGVKTNARSANWYAKIGTDENHVIVAGCQIHYAVRCDNRPSDSALLMEDYFEGKVALSEAPSRIYFTE